MPAVCPNQFFGRSCTQISEIKVPIEIIWAAVAAFFFKFGQFEH